MVTQSFDSYAERLLPQLLRQHVRRDSDEDLCQRVLLDILKKWPVLDITSDEEFSAVFKQYLSVYQWVKRSREARSRVRGTYWITHAQPTHVPSLNIDSEAIMLNPSFLTATINPWKNPQIEALEFIELLPTSLFRRIFTLYYIEGYTLQEIGQYLGMTRKTCGKIIDEGVAFLQDLQQRAAQEGRTAREAPTPKV